LLPAVVENCNIEIAAEVASVNGRWYLEYERFSIPVLVWGGRTWNSRALTPCGWLIFLDPHSNQPTSQQKVKTRLLFVLYKSYKSVHLPCLPKALDLPKSRSDNWLAFSNDWGTEIQTAVPGFRICNHIMYLPSCSRKSLSSTAYGHRAIPHAWQSCYISRVKENPVLLRPYFNVDS
jgi:hypothetical protein